MRFICCLAVLLVPAPVCLAQDITRMEQVVQSFVSQDAFSGAVLVARGSEVVFSKGYGLANAEWKIPNGPDARYRVASITKQFTAAAILMLEERRLLRVNDPIRTHLPDAPASWDRMTIFHLLTHTAGFQGLQTPPAARTAPVVSPDGTVQGFVANLMKQPLESPPGERFNYTNSGYYVLGHLIETLSGQTYAQFVRENFFIPLGMNDTGLDGPAVLERRASSYTRGQRGLVNFYPASPISPNPAGGFYSTTGDLLRWQIALYGGNVLSPASLQKMTTPFKGDYGLGVYVRDVDGRRTITHSGGAPPFANLTYFPDDRISVVALGNVTPAAAPEIAALLGRVAHGAPVVLLSERKAIVVAPEMLARYAGVYEMAGGQALIVRLDGQQLSIQPPGGSALPLLAESERRFFVEQSPFQFEFVVDDAGVATELILHQGTRQDRARRTSERPN